MSKQIICLLILLAVALTNDYELLLSQEQGSHVSQFQDFATKHNKLYTGPKHVYESLQQFKNNLIHISLHQQKDLHANYGITKFADISPQEFQDQYLNLPYEEIQKEDFLGKRNLRIFDWLWGPVDVSDIPKNFDWRDKGIITEPKQQDSCGACWSFATTGILEAQYALKHKELLEFSEQFLIDCDGNDKGCSGGLMTNAYKYLQYHKIPTKEQYGDYQDRQDTCHSTNTQGVTKVKSFYQISKDENSILREVYENGPVAVGVNGRFLQFYQNGVLNPGPDCDDKINHAVLIVGFGENEKGIPYWIIKNQWGNYWGEKGYYRMVRGQKMCGVHTYASMAFIE